ncbi:mitochondrial 37S ribosomal protein bS6m [Kockiozyma suomiensis]|uniref:mitochondrial 37S ribosomal protein bS6m n=1 Tax=Kockiozyma suomiensis TaxID=1337062 RepID=UPI003342F29F
MLYELVGIARVNTMSEVRDIVRTAGTMITNSGGVVRNANFLGRQFLPHVMGVHQQLHFAGNHFHMMFDSNPKVQNDIYSLLKSDPRMIRITIVNRGKDLVSLTKKHRPAPSV